MAENGTTIAKAYVQIMPSALGIKAGLNKAMGGDVDAAGASAGQSFGGKMVGAIKGVLATAAIGKAFSAAISEGAALEQSLGGIETLFKGSADTVIANAQNAYRTAGLSANAYMESVTGFSARLLQGLGGDTQAAAALADTAMVDMADNANKMGTDMATIQQTYQSLARGNYEMLDNLKLGYGGTQAEMARLINDSGVLGDTMVATAENVNSIGFDKMIEAIHVVQDEMGITGTTALEAATTLTGSLNAMKASFQNVLGSLTLGQDVAPALNALAQTVTTFLTGNLLPAVWNVLSALPGALVTFTGALVPQLAAGLAAFIPQVAAQITAAAPQMLAAGLAMIQQLGQGLAQGIPNFLAQALPLLLNFTSNLRANFGQIVGAGVELLLNLAQGLINGLPTMIQYIPQIVSNIAGLINDNAPKLLQGGLKLIVMLGQGLIQAIPTLLANLPQIIQAIVDVFTAFNWVSLGTNIITMLKNGITSMIGVVQSAGQSVFNAVKNAITNLPAVLKSLGSNAIQSLAGGIRALLYDAQMAGVSVFTAIRTALASLPSELLSLGSNAISSMASGLRGMIGAVTGAASSIVSGIVGAIQSLPSRALSIVRSAISGIVSAFTSGNWVSIGANIINGIISGIGSAIGGLINAAKNAVSSALNTAKSALGIASPSKVMRDQVGRFIPLGIAEGITDNTAPLRAAMQDAADQLVQPVRGTAALGYSAAWQPAYAAPGAGQGAGTQQTFNFYQPVQTPDEFARAVRIQTTYGLAGAR